MDLNNITYFLSLNPTIDVRLAAERLDIELHHKYPTINIMINVANNVSVCNTSSTECEHDPMDFFKTDYYGIICDTLLKKRIISSIEEFIEGRD